jgi:peptidoglycan/xylan/chitin deacetylase (PgdA/CDA1 family)
MFRILIGFIGLWLLSCAQAAELTALVYHGVVADPGNDPYSVSHSQFVAQLDYLKSHGYQPVSLDLLEKARTGAARLPDKALLLTFDDGLRSYAEFVAPLLKTYGYPSLVSVETGWVDGLHVPPEYRDRLMNWDDLRQLRKSPLVEIISHSHDLHHGIPSNPQGNEDAAGTTRRYFPESRTYENEAGFRQRIRRDMEKTVSEFKRHLGFAPRAIAWPYGSYDDVLVEEAARAGMPFYLTMENGPTPVEQLPRIRRIIVRNTPSLSGFVDDLQYDYRLYHWRVVEFNLDPFKAASAARQEELLSRLLDRLQAVHANTVILSPFTADRRAAFFYNRQMPVAGDVLNRVLHQILTRLRVQRIYLKLPESLPVASLDDLYTDLARLNWFSGVVFETPRDAGAEGRLRRLIRYYHPIVKFGVEGQAPVSGYDFTIVRLDPGSSPERIDALARDIKRLPRETLVVLGRKPDEDGGELAARLRRLRGSGIEDFGYGPDDYAAGLPATNPVVPEMAADATRGKED